jgi:hypothetical protein
VIGDVVEDGGASYVCISGNINHEPPDAQYWDVLAEKGDQGDQGEQGIQGEPGNTWADPPDAADKIVVSDGVGTAAWEAEPWSHAIAAPGASGRMLVSTSETEVSWGSVPDVAGHIDSNTSIYISTTGNDTTGDGTTGNPYATIEKALELIAEYRILDGVTVTIVFKDGTYSITDDVTINRLDGGNIHIIGENTHVLSMTDVVSYSGTTGNYSVVLQLVDASDCAVGDFLMIPKGITGGTNVRRLSGVWRITNVDSVNERVTVYVTTLGTSSGPDTTSVKLIKSVLSFAAGKGLIVDQRSAIGLLDDIVIRGAGSGSGVSVKGGAILTCSDGFGVSGFANGIYIYPFGNMTAPGMMSCNNTNGVYMVSGLFSAVGGVFSGNTSNGVFFTVLSNVTLTSSYFVGNLAGINGITGGGVNFASAFIYDNTNYGVLLDGNVSGNGQASDIQYNGTGAHVTNASFCVLPQATLNNNTDSGIKSLYNSTVNSYQATIQGNTNYGIYAFTHGVVSSYSMTIGSNGTDCSPTLNVEGNVGSIIVGS